MQVDVCYIISGLGKNSEKISNQDLQRQLTSRILHFLSLHSILVESFAVAAVSWNVLEILTVPIVKE